MSQYEYDKCPWCKAEIDDLWEYNLDDGDDKDTECPSCDKKINIELNVSYDYKIRRTGCEHHTLDLHEYYRITGDRGPVHFECTNCKAEFYNWELPGGKHAKVKEGEFEFVGDAIKVAKEKGLLK